MIMVNSIMPMAYTTIPAFTLPSGMMWLTRSEITSPTPAAVKTEPRQASSMGSMDRGPTVDSMRSESFRKVEGLLSRFMIISRMMATRTPRATPFRADRPMPMPVMAQRTASMPMLRVGTKIFMPIFS